MLNVVQFWKHSSKLHHRTAVARIVKSVPAISSRNLELSESIKLEEGLQLEKGWDLLNEI